MTNILPLALLLAWSTSCDKKEEPKKDEAKKDDRGPIDPELRSPTAYRSWSFGVTDYDPLFRFTAADWDSTRPAYCKSPLTMLEQIKLEIDANPRGCSPVKVTEDDTGLYLRLKCSVPG